MMARTPHRHVVAPWLAVQSHRDWWLATGAPAIVLAVALMWPHLGWWSLGVALAVYGCCYVGYGRFQASRSLTAELATALGRLPELGGGSAPGHAARSATVAVAVGRRLGLDDASLAAVGNAARAAHVGRVGLGRPGHPRPGFDRHTADEWSAAIIRRAPGLELAPETVSSDPSGDPSPVPVRSVVLVAAAYDDAASGLGLPADEALVMASLDAPARSGPALDALGAIFGVPSSTLSTAGQDPAG